MIVLDAAVVIALLDAGDTHHRAAHDLIRAHLDDDLGVNPINLAEALVRPAALGRAEEAIATLDAIGVTTVPLPAAAAARLAAIRAETGSKMPDCCVLLTAEECGAAVATFDERLRASARRLNLTVV